MPYLNVAQVETALSLAATTYPGITELITLPNNTWEGRTCHAIKIGRPSGATKPSVFFLGCVHGREWGSADILVNFINQLLQAYQTVTSLTFGGRTFTPTEIQDVVDTLDVIVFPQANPDGRNESMTGDPMWRKNRRTSAPNSTLCRGVDINRNFDFLWDFLTHFDPGSGVVTSNDPCDPETYCGPAAFSEPETQNCRWIFDTFPTIGAFIDLHSFGQKILYSWGDDESQAADAAMNFRNPLYDGLRGKPGDAYREYLPSGDRARAVALATTLKNAVQDVRGTVYTVDPGFALYLQPTSGASDDYAYSRHFVDSNKKNVIAFTIEWGTSMDLFHPLYAEMANIIPEITCGLLAFCLDLCKEENTMAWQTRGNAATDPITDFVGTTDNEPVVVKANGVEALRVTPAGNVGIGTSNPGRTLDIASSVGSTEVVIRDNSEPPNQRAWRFMNNGQQLAIEAVNDALTGGTGVINCTRAGRVGIGTTQPGAKLELNNGDLLIKAAAEDAGDIIFQSAGGGQKARIWSHPAPGAGLYLSSGDNNPDITIDSEGRVGIGTVSPTSKLTVEGGSALGFALSSVNASGGGSIVGTASGKITAVGGIALGSGAGVQGVAAQTTPTSFGVLGITDTISPVSANFPGGIGVVGQSTAGAGVAGLVTRGDFGGVEGTILGGQGAGVKGHASTATTVGVYGDNSGGGQAARFLGNVGVSGTITASGKAFCIDHPLDPEHKYLNHCSVESPEMLTVYNGIAITDDDGEAVVKLPDYFQALNRDFTYQLTIIGEFAQAIIAREIEDNSFAIRTDRPRIKVCWQVTGIRHDPYAVAHRLPVEQEKSDAERGRYLHPELYKSSNSGCDDVKPIGHMEAMLAGAVDKRTTEVR